MRLSKISSAPSLQKDAFQKEEKGSSGEQNQQASKAIKSRISESNRGNIPLIELNVILEQKGLPYRLVEGVDSINFECLKTGDILGVLDEQYMSDLLDDVRLVEEEKLRKLTYEKSNTSGNFLNLDI